jgi:hypothetical protein
MILERLEELCINYLQQAENPVVPVGALLEFCRRDAGCADTTLEELQSFLRPHADIQFIEGPTSAESVTMDDFSQAGLEMGARAVLNTRIPSKKEMAAMMVQQLNDMRELLNTSLTAAQKEGDAAKAMQIEAALAQSEVMQKKILSLK